MGLIKVEGIRCRAFHGCLEEEALIGGDYIVNVHAQGDLSEAEQSDQLNNTVDYGEVTSIVMAEMSQRSKLIEHVANRILQSLKARWESISFTVEVIKLKPPINGNVEQVSYTV